MNRKITAASKLPNNQFIWTDVTVCYFTAFGSRIVAVLNGNSYPEFTSFVAHELARKTCFQPTFKQRVRNAPNRQVGALFSWPAVLDAAIRPSKLRSGYIFRVIRSKSLQPISRRASVKTRNSYMISTITVTSLAQISLEACVVALCSAYNASVNDCASTNTT